MIHLQDEENSAHTFSLRTAQAKWGLGGWVSSSVHRFCVLGTQNIHAVLVFCFDLGCGTPLTILSNCIMEVSKGSSMDNPGGS